MPSFKTVLTASINLDISPPLITLLNGFNGSPLFAENIKHTLSAPFADCKFAVSLVYSPNTTVNCALGILSVLNSAATFAQKLSAASALSAVSRL